MFEKVVLFLYRDTLVSQVTFYAGLVVISLYCALTIKAWPEIRRWKYGEECRLPWWRVCLNFLPPIGVALLVLSAFADGPVTRGIALVTAVSLMVYHQWRFRPPRASA